MIESEALQSADSEREIVAANNNKPVAALALTSAYVKILAVRARCRPEAMSAAETQQLGAAVLAFIENEEQLQEAFLS